MDSERRNAIWIFFYTLALSSKERREGLKALRVWCKTAGTGERTAAFGPVPYICLWLSDVNGEKKQDRILWKFVQKMSPTQDCQSRRQNGEFAFPADTCEKGAACFLLQILRTLHFVFWKQAQSGTCSSAEKGIFGAQCGREEKMQRVSFSDSNNSLTVFQVLICPVNRVDQPTVFVRFKKCMRFQFKYVYKIIKTKII